ncbi:MULTISPECIES: hypothetical protein [unclassified Mameliella]|nr:MULTISPECIES: hypothetical protein [unclassified Mameliella]
MIDPIVYRPDLWRGVALPTGCRAPRPDSGSPAGALPVDRR